MLAYRNSHQNEPQRQHLLNPEKKKCSKYFKTKQGRLAFTRIREMRYRTKEILWSQFSAAQEHHTAVRTDILLEPVCMLICVHWKGGFFSATIVNPLPRQTKAAAIYRIYSMAVKELQAQKLGSLEAWLGYCATSQNHMLQKRKQHSISTYLHLFK